MKRKIMFAAVLLFAAVTGFAQIDKDRSESGYLLIKDADKKLPEVSLESTAVNVQVDGVIANVCVKQVYVNKGKKKLEGVYIFPGSTRAAVYGMTMKVGKRTIVASVREKQKAREEYEKAKKKGKTASLLEQHRPNVFQMNVANIAPKDTVVIEMSYTELLEYNNDLYEFVYPGTVGPRYDTGGEEWVKQTHTLLNSTFNISVNIRAGMPIDIVKSTSHEIIVLNPFQLINWPINTNMPASMVNIIPANPKDYNSSKDFILEYGLRGAKVQSGMLTYQHNDENFFLLMVQAPKKVQIDEIPPREYIFIVDVSGSMYGFPLEISKRILRELISSLRPTDRFNVMLFESSSAMMSENSLPATAENIERAIRVIDRQSGGGGTELYPALKKAFEFKTTPDFARTFIIATDGYVTIEKEAFELTQQNRNKFNLFALGIGNRVNRYLVEGLAYAGGGQAYIINNKTEADAVGKRLIKDISTPVLSHIEIDWGKFNAYDVTPSTVADLFEAKPVVVYGKYKGKPSGEITIKGITGTGDFTQVFNLKNADNATSPALRYLWARNKIKYLSDYATYFEQGGNGYSETNEINKANEKEVTAMGLKYNLMTKYTSFLAVDDEPLEVIETWDITGNAVAMEMPILEKGIYMEAEPEPEAVPFVIVETAATFMGGGIDEFSKWVMKNLKLPEAAIQNGISGTIVVEFTVDKTGQVTNIKVLRSIDTMVDNEVVRVIKTSAKWKPATQAGKSVDVKFVLPVKIKLL